MQTGGKLPMGHLLSLTLFAATDLLFPAPADEPPTGVTRWSLAVTETEGIRRFGYPVHVVLPVDRALLDRGDFRLQLNDKYVPAQFSPHPEPDKAPASVSVDFTVNHAPFEQARYEVEHVSQRGEGPVPRGEMKAELGKESVKVLHPGGLEFELPHDLLGLLRQVRSGKKEYLRPDSFGLFLVGKDGRRYRAGDRPPDGPATAVSVTRAGPMAVGLRFEGAEVLGGGPSVRSVVEAEFPSSKSWVRVAWRVDDPNGSVAGLGAELNLNVQGEPTLVDFGAGSLVYAQLRKGRSAAMRAGSLGRKEDAGRPAWTTWLGEADKLAPYVVAPKRKDSPPAEGWAHVMDRERCTAVAVAGFADAGQESKLHIDADGRLWIGRTFARGEMAVPRGPKQLTFWLHFVPMPVHVGAATSPQAMLAPLLVQVKALEKEKR
jgi:hypothetical protein